MQISLFTGKGGTGKTSVAIAHALACARKHSKVAFVDFSESELAADFFLKHKSIKHHGLSWEKWPVHKVLFQFITHYFPISFVVKKFFESRTVSSLIEVAPGLKELAWMGQLTSKLRGVGPPLDYDYFFVDALPTGQFKNLLTVPRGLSHVVKTGWVNEQTRAIEKWICDPKICRVFIVSLGDDLSQEEAFELCSFLKKEFFIEPTIILNGFVPIDSFSSQGDLESSSLRISYTNFAHLIQNEQRQLSGASDERSFQLFMEYLAGQIKAQEECYRLFSSQLTYTLPYFFGDKEMGSFAKCNIIEQMADYLPEV